VIDVLVSKSRDFIDSRISIKPRYYNKHTLKMLKYLRLIEGRHVTGCVSNESVDNFKLPIMANLK
jgi:hypothetical protein